MRSSALKGFTLIELMVVITILAVLTIVAVASYKSYALRAQAQEGRQLLMELQMKQESYFATYSEYVTANPGGVSWTNLYPPTTQFAKMADGSPDDTRFDWSAMDCSNPGTNEVGWCNLGFRPQGATRFRLGTWGWNPASAALPSVSGLGDAGNLITNLDTTQRWYTAVAMRDGDQDAAKGETVKYAILVMTSQHNEIVAVDMDE